MEKVEGVIRWLVEQRWRREDHMLMYERYLFLAGFVYKLLREKKRARIREIYYHSKDRYFSDIRMLNRYIHGLRKMMECHRWEMNIDAAEKGAVCGRLCWNESKVIDHQTQGDDLIAESVHWEDLSAIQGGEGKVIAGDFPMRSSKICWSHDAEYLLIVEKFAIYQQLVQVRFWQRLPCIIMTGKGYPDIATQCFLRSFTNTFPAIKVVGLCDYNPHGLHIMLQYMMCNSNDQDDLQPLINVGVIGIHHADAIQVAAEHWQPMTSHDEKTLQIVREKILSLSRDDDSFNGFLKQLTLMSFKVEIESIGGVDKLQQMIIDKIVSKNFI